MNDHWLDYLILGFVALTALIIAPAMAYMAVGEAASMWAYAKETMLKIREREHQRRVEIMAKQIELEQALIARESASPSLAAIKSVEAGPSRGEQP